MPRYVGNQLITVCGDSYARVAGAAVIFSSAHMNLPVQSDSTLGNSLELVLRVVAGQENSHPCDPHMSLTCAALGSETADFRRYIPTSVASASYFMDK